LVNDAITAKKVAFNSTGEFFAIQANIGIMAIWLKYIWQCHNG